MARKDPPGLIYLGDGVEVTATVTENDVVLVKVRRWMPDGTKRGGLVCISLECLKSIQEAGMYEQLAFVAKLGESK